ncbi:restriction endonuclease [Streptomyces javensis]|uniref:Restriction endonuclease n=1 Tax=Streptomyces javensis TaxID=114698 RepID=A0ABS0R6R4_9ACTN|nr:restriction endonuclease [Streptomyces javensis]MBI0313054.1 restriction endonuclease [Streptomyces javensis]
MASTSRSPRPSRSRRSRKRRLAGRRPTRRSTFARGAVRLSTGEWLIIGILIALAITGISDYLAQHPVVLATLLTLLGLGGTLTATLWGRSRYRRWRRDGHGQMPTRIDSWRALSPDGFERAVARLCRRDGCTSVKVLGGTGDRAGDVKARTPDGRWVLLQCKRYQEGNNVGSRVLYEVNGTYRVTHRCDIAAIVTTSSFTTSAVDWNSDLEPEQRLRLVGARQLLEWADGTGPAPWE